MRKDFNVIIERDAEGYYIGYVPSLKGCHTQAKSLDELMERIKEAIELCLEEESEDEININDFIGVKKLLRDKNSEEDLIDIVTIEQRKRETSISLEEYLSKRKTKSS